ncbi:hypothetical protein GC105_13665 [Alkalibaculum sp. M08DMB]|uniref:Uncharacterized protein n=1 Tax=Alkalibaculum sporogenes TaxID=2655001 RepID=A0A6A7KBB3_9FIRM|nr:hypothetical protein [Alkalibaculum sporogenes]MPW26830.1 hypothetical protein [Alkalibaculum sporogenes]
MKKVIALLFLAMMFLSFTSMAYAQESDLGYEDMNEKEVKAELLKIRENFSDEMKLADQLSYNYSLKTNAEKMNDDLHIVAVSEKTIEGQDYQLIVLSSGVYNTLTAEGGSSASISGGTQYTNVTVRAQLYGTLSNALTGHTFRTILSYKVGNVNTVTAANLGTQFATTNQHRVTLNPLLWQYNGRTGLLYTGGGGTTPLYNTFRIKIEPMASNSYAKNLRLTGYLY